MRRVRRVGPALLALLAIVWVGPERWARLLRRIDQRGGAFTSWGAGLYSRVAPRVVGGLYERVASDVAAALPTGTVLDVGSGPGLVAITIAQRQAALHVFGVDVSPEMVRIARDNARRLRLDDRVHFEIGNATSLPAADESIDLVISTLSLHHWAQPADALREFARVLKPNASAWIYDLRGVTYSRREFERHSAATPFAGHVRTSRLHAGRLPVALYTGFVLQKAGTGQ
jgi:ubiquinone/menaquinone biosynthesis C-methylase UbiE